MKRTVIFSLRAALCSLECPAAHSPGLQQRTGVGTRGTLHFSWISLWSTGGKHGRMIPVVFTSAAVESRALRTSENAPRSPRGALFSSFFPAVASDPSSFLFSFHAWPFGEAVNTPAFRCGLAARCVNGFFFSSTGLQSCSAVCARVCDHSCDLRLHTSTIVVRYLRLLAV